MAKQKGLVRVLGTGGDMTYYKTKDGYLAKEKTSLTGTQIATDPRFKRTRENMAEFGNACTSGKTLRHSINTLLQNATDGKVVSRLSKTMMQVLKTDTTDKRGKRTVANGDVTLLKGFEFNANSILGSTLYAPYTTSITRATGVLSVSIPAFVPATSIIAPLNATHFKLVFAGVAADFAAQQATAIINQTAVLPWDETATSLITLTANMPAASTLPLLLVLGIQFFQEVNGNSYPLTDGSFNALSVIGADK
jgi:hypothetical protein